MRGGGPGIATDAAAGAPISPPSREIALALPISRPRLRAKLVLIGGTATAAVVAAGAAMALSFHERKILQIEQQASVLDAEEVKVVLEEQMRTGERTALNRLIDQIGNAPGVAWVGVTDAHGTIHISSNDARGTIHISRNDARKGLRGFAADSQEMERLRGWTKGAEMRTETLLRPGCSVMRTISPLPNDKGCVSCHGDGPLVTGMLVIDRSLSGLQADMASSERLFLGAGAATILALFLALGLSVERLILIPLGRLRAAARRLGSGELSARAGDCGEDEVGDVASDFDGMATRLEAAMETVAAERCQLRHVLNGISDGIVLLDASLHVVMVNRSCAARLADPARSQGIAYQDLIRAAGLSLDGGPRLPAERALESGALEKEIVQGAGGERFEEIYAQPLRDHHGATVGVIEVWRDTTDRKVLEAGLEESERLAALGLLASSVAHEVGNPLAAIVTAVDGLLLRLDEPDGASREDLREYLELVRRQVFRCSGVTGRLLGFARAPSSRLVEVDAAVAARDVLALVAAQARAQQVELRALLPGPIAVVAAEHLLEQVFLNLALNALHAMPSGGSLAVRAHVRSGEVAIDFEDTGPGIPESVRRRLFEPLRRGDRQGPGTGLGLFISRSLIAKCGGRISVESAPGRGACFTVVLPRAEPASAALPVARAIA